MADSDIQFEDIWNHVFSLYEEKTNRDLKTDPLLGELRTTDDLLLQINARQRNFEAFRQKKAKLWSILRGSMIGVELVGGLTQDALTLTPFSMASPVLGAVLFLVSSAGDVSKAYDTIVDLLSQLEDFTGRLQEYTNATVEPKLRKKLIDVLACLLEIFARSEKLIRKGRVKQYFSVTFLRSNEKVAAALERLKSLMDTEAKLVGSLTYSTLLRTDESVSQGLKVMERTETLSEWHQESLEDSKKDANEKAERERIDKELDRTTLRKVQDYQNDISERRLTGTCDWIRKEPLFQQWIAQESPILWILGGPGAGKSFLSSKIIAHLQEKFPQDPHVPSRESVGYFYVREDDQQLRSLNAILKSLALQIATNNPIYRKHAANVCNSPDKIGTAKHTWQNLFLDFFSSDQNRDSVVFIVIDGLDEAPKKEQTAFLKILRRLLRQSSGVDQAPMRLHFAMVGRPELRESILSVWASQIIYIEVSAAKNTPDIDDYIKRGIHKVKALKNRHISSTDRELLKATIVQKLQEGALGMFLWVNLMLDQICNVSRPSSIEGILKEAPHDLAKMIRHVFQRLAADPGVQKEDINEMLTWVTFAQRPLLLGEMDVILKLRPPVGEGMPDLEDRLRGQFASFFILNREDSKTTEDLASELAEKFKHKMILETPIDGPHDLADEEQGFDILELPSYESDFKATELAFSHASIRDYLLQEGRAETRRWPSDLGIGIEVNKAKHHVTVFCLTVLRDKEHEKTFPGTNLLTYAADNVLTHLKGVDRLSLTTHERQAVIDPLFNLLDDDATIERWFSNISSDKDIFIRDWLTDKDLEKCIGDWLADEENQRHGFSASSSYVQLLQSTLLIEKIPTARLRLIADDPQYEKTAYWHHRLGAILREASYFEAAIEEFDISFQMYDGDWILHWNMSRAYESLEDYSSALSWAEKALTIVPTKEKSIILQDISRWRLNLDDVEEAIEAAHAAWSLAPENPRMGGSYLYALNAGFKYKEIMDVATYLSVTTSQESQENQLSLLLLNTFSFHEFIGNAAREMGDLNFAEKAIENAITAAERRKDLEELATQRCELAIFLDRHAFRTSKAIVTFELVLESIASRKSVNSFEDQRHTAVKYLAQLYYNEAVATRSQDKPSEHWISKLQGLAKSGVAPDGEDVYSTRIASTMLGLWYRNHGKESEAKACLRPRFLEGIDMLTDDDPANDQFGYDVLSEILLKAGDRENAGAALAVTTAPLDKLKSIRSTKEKAAGQSLNSNAGEEDSTPALPAEESKPNTTPADTSSPSPPTTKRSLPSAQKPLFIYECDGNCKRKVEDWTAFYVCEICIDTAFCDQCIELVKTARLPFKKCHANHIFYQAYPLEEKADEIASVVVDGKVLPRKEWLEGLRREWVA
ncbi:uncharacterized protein KY384_002258 [Bacidia gigantensis]|uniref:uncharacterized protein n=1 Tax=Bacidia gigantensis TaxID=2732470 RepID=UPI001D0516BC|nr:uncharacterized protein KY384_002258 [Bacidia gigantensis]KAG8533475.1 hypothetical protein KY384_002258 [Bacidia gigantensis]